MSIHLVISHDEKYAIVNALAFYDRYHKTNGKFDTSNDDELCQWKICFREDNRGADVVDKLATKVAQSF